MQDNHSSKNKTIKLTKDEISSLDSQIYSVFNFNTSNEFEGKVFNNDLMDLIKYIPDNYIDLLFLDPPYNLDKKFGDITFTEGTVQEYLSYLERWFIPLINKLKSTASVYICGDWRSSAAIHLLTEKYLKVRNRITFEREKGRGAKSNWKNCSEDIWFCTVSDNYVFNIDKVKSKRKVIAPYTKENGEPKDWLKTESGNFRVTHPSNIWTDITIPFWSMPENTEHPTQKPEKLLAKIILASTNEGDIVFDPFCGSGTALVVAKKLKRKFFGCDINRKYCLLTLKRLLIAENNKRIQGYEDGVFWDRNVLNK